MASMQLHSDQRWDAFQQRFDDAQEENLRSFSAINERMDRMDNKLNFLCNSNQMLNENLFFPYQATERTMREIQQQGIPITMDNLKIHRVREEEMQQERQRYQRILDEAASARANEQNKGKEQNRVLTPRRHYPRLGVAELTSPFSPTQHSMPRRDARRLGMDGAARKLALHQGLKA
ncbi:hypothetical protein PIB30_040887 [Stylosanthes scabra]|uniref:Uncharacterized protein n=1 Tax=Stylosanthes scabra TaxID=79078 RepID=A0ABU6UEY2_9FABA|nr:hypothetical protein [Stylosanthes scabra]